MPKSTRQAFSLSLRPLLTVRQADGLLFQFLKEVKDQADKMGWTKGILSILTKNIGETNKAEEDFLSNYGRTLTLKQVVACL
jgi:hypothetical protein